MSDTSEQMKSTVKTWERKILRKIYGPIEGQNSWIIRTIDELQFMCNKPHILTTIKVRMADDKEVFLGKSGGRRKMQQNQN